MYKDAKENHKKMWDFVVNNPEADKCEWPGWKSNGGNIEYVWNHCFACDVARKLIPPGENISPCGLCPVKWEGGIKCLDKTSLWSRYIEAMEAEKYDEVKRIATLIRDIPWKRTIKY